jgi:hypothetical protein
MAGKNGAQYIENGFEKGKTRCIRMAPVGACVRVVWSHVGQAECHSIKPSVCVRLRVSAVNI